MRKTPILIILTAIILVLGCAKDIIVKSPPTLSGIYHGEYVYVDKPDQSGGKTSSQWIKWTFTDYTYIMDTDRTDLKDPFTCDKWYGTYKLENNVIFDNARGVGQCDTILQKIEGAFTLTRKRSDDPLRDTLVLEQWGPSNIFHKIIEIIKDSAQ